MSRFTKLLTNIQSMVNSIKGKSMKNHSPDIMKLAPLMNLDEMDLYFLTNCNYSF